MIARRPKHDPGKGAFTLLEVLIAVSIFAIVLAAINTVFYGALRLRNQTVQRLERALPVQNALETIKRDITGIVRPGTLGGVLASGASAGSALGSIASISGESGQAIYTHTGLVTDALPWGDVQKVTYFLRPPTNAINARTAGQDLMRGVTRNLLPGAQEERDDEWIMGDVSRIQFQFYSGTEWSETWDSTQEETVLPKAVKVRIEIAAEAGELRGEQPAYELVVPVVIDAQTNQTQNAEGQG